MSFFSNLDHFYGIRKLKTHGLSSSSIYKYKFWVPFFKVTSSLQHKIDHLKATCTSFYGIRKLKSHGLSSCPIYIPTKATTTAKLLGLLCLSILVHSYLQLIEKSLWKTPKKSQIPGSLQAIHPISLKSSCFYTTPSMSFTNSDPTALLHTLSNHQLRPISTKAYSPIRRKLYSQLLYKNICYILIIYSTILTTFIINYHSC